MSAEADLIQIAVRSRARPPAKTPPPDQPASLPAEIDQTAPQSKAPEPMDLVAGLPPEVAELHIFEEGKHHFSVLGVHGGKRETLVKQQAPPRKDIKGNNLTARDVFRLMGELSSGPAYRKLRSWLNRAIQAHQTNFVLKLVEHKDARVPWEMFRLTDVGHRYLGALVTVARHIPDPDAADPFDPDEQFDLAATECRDLIAYVDPEERQRVAAQHALIERLARTRLPDIDSLRLGLQEPPHPCGVLYVFCHGFVHKKSFRSEFGSFTDKAKRLNLSDLRMLALNLFERTGCLVFMNACGSAQQTLDKDYLCDGHRRGFTELFLNKGARGVIGTLDDVEIELAACIAKDFFDFAAQQDDRCAAAILRDVRGRAIADWRADQLPTEEQVSLWFYTFLYAYYGNPHLVLRLGP